MQGVKKDYTLSCTTQETFIEPDAYSKLSSQW